MLPSKILIPLEISGIISSFIGHHFALYSATYYWYINEELTTTMKNCKVGALFTEIMKIGETEWTLKLVKNHSSV